eukprot:scaffold57706_cov82-Phaeocystis_antarctica.AAC.7
MRSPDDRPRAQCIGQGKQMRDVPRTITETRPCALVIVEVGFDLAVMHAFAGRGTCGRVGRVCAHRHVSLRSAALHAAVRAAVLPKDLVQRLLLRVCKLILGRQPVLQALASSLAIPIQQVVIASGFAAHLRRLQRQCCGNVLWGPLRQGFLNGKGHRERRRHDLKHGKALPRGIPK